MEDNAIGFLYSTDRDLWCETYFPEYAALSGGYPPVVPLFYYDPTIESRRPKIKGSTGAFEMTPWLAWPFPRVSPIDPSGTKVIPSKKLWVRQEVVKVKDDEFQHWCDQRNFYKNGGLTPRGNKGLDPAYFEDAFTMKLWGVGKGYLNKFAIDDLRTDSPHIVTKFGRYFPSAKISKYNPYGKNAMFYFWGEDEPHYVQDLYGPDYVRNTGRAKRYARGRKWTQDDYNEERFVEFN